MLRIETIEVRKLAEIAFRSIVEKVYSSNELNFKTKCPYLGNNVHKSVIVLLNEEISAFATLFINDAIAENSIMTIGNFECIDNDVIAKCLFDCIAEESKIMQIKTVIGPMNGSTWEKYRLSKPSKHPIFLTEDLYPNYYHTLFTKNDFVEYERYVSNKQELFIPTEEQNTWFETFLTDNNLSFSYVSKINYVSELPRIFEFCQTSFEGNKLFSPISKNDFIEKYTQFESILHPISVMLVEDSAGKIVGLLLTIPNLYSKNELIVKTMAVHPDFRSKGIANAFGIELMNRANEHQFETIIHAFMHVENHSTNVSKKYHGEVIREYVIFKKK